MKKILIAEDDSFLANAYRAKLTKAGYEIKIARDGNEALEALATYAPDMVILDLVMPSRDGFSVLSELKKSPKWKGIPTLVASNLGQKEDVDRARGLGADDYIVKTDLSMNKLIEKIKSMVGG